jgi:hypothetical protein
MPYGSTQLESSLYRREVPEYVVVVERTHQVTKGLTGVSSVLKAWDLAVAEGIDEQTVVVAGDL